MSKSCEWPPRSLSLRVLGYVEDNKWIAHCLELDLVGEGRSFPDACRHLHELIDMQVSFAVFKKNPDLLYHEAPHEYFTLFERLQREAIEMFPRVPRGGKHRIANLPLTRPDSPSRFARAHA